MSLAHLLGHRLGHDELAALPRREQVFARRARLLRQSNLPRRALGVLCDDLRSIDPVVIEEARAWMRASVRGDHPGVGLALCDAPGRGKTSLACAVAQEWLLAASVDQLGQHEGGYDCQWPLYYTTMPGFLRVRGHAIGGDTEQKAEARWLLSCMFGEATPSAGNVRLLVLDDVGKEHAAKSRWAEDSFDELLRARYDAALPTVITTNVEWDRWDRIYSPAMKSFASEAFVWTESLGPDDLREREVTP